MTSFPTFLRNPIFQIQLERLWFAKASNYDITDDEDVVSSGFVAEGFGCVFCCNYFQRKRSLQISIQRSSWCKSDRLQLVARLLNNNYLLSTRHIDNYHRYFFSKIEDGVSLFNFALIGQIFWYFVFVWGFVLDN